MKYSSIFFAFIFAVITLYSCNGDLKERQLNLELREQNLAEREKNFSLKEQEYQRLLKMKDSIHASKVKIDTLSLPKEFLGKWNIKMLCTESSCNEHAIGDVRNDDFEFYVQDNKFYGKVSNRQGFLRVYSGKYNGENIHLLYRTDSTAAKPVSINMSLTPVNKNKITGTRQLTGDKNCVAKFSVELTRPKN